MSRTKWLQYLTALSLSLPSLAMAAPAPKASAPVAISSAAGDRISGMSNAAVAPSTGVAPQLMPVWGRAWFNAWQQAWFQVVAAKQTKVAANDVGSFRNLLEEVKQG